MCTAFLKEAALGYLCGLEREREREREGAVKNQRFFEEIIMSQKKVREYDAKRILSRWLHDYSENEHSASSHFVRVSSEDVARTFFF